MAGNGTRIDDGIDSAQLNPATRQTPKGVRLRDQRSKHEKDDGMHAEVVHLVEFPDQGGS